MPKVITLPDPTGADIPTITLEYDNGIIAGGLVSLKVLGPDGQIETKFVPFRASDLSATLRTQLNNLNAAAINKVMNVLGYA